MVYDISRKTLLRLKPLLVRFDEVDEFIRGFDGARYLALFGSGKHDAIYNRLDILYLKKVALQTFLFIIMQKSKLIHLILYLSLTFHNLIILIKSVRNKDTNHFYSKILLEKCSHF